MNLAETVGVVPGLRADRRVTLVGGVRGIEVPNQAVRARHRGEPAFRASLEAVMWELRKGSRTARCELWRHPLGWEVRCDVDGETSRPLCSGGGTPRRIRRTTGSTRSPCP